MRYAKFSLMLIVMILLLMACGTPPDYRGEILNNTATKSVDNSDIYKAYAYFSTAAQGLQSMARGKELKATNQSIKNNIINGWQTIPVKYLPTNFSKQKLVEQSQNINNNHCYQLLGNTLLGLAMVNEYTRANELVKQYCEHPDTIQQALEYISDITNVEFVDKLKKNVNFCK